MGKKLKVYAGAEHPHMAQKPPRDQDGGLNSWQNEALYYGTGRRKNAVARVRLVPGTGKVTVNGRDGMEYFGREALLDYAKTPFKVTDTLDHFDVLATHRRRRHLGPGRRSAPRHRPCPAGRLATTAPS